MSKHWSLSSEIEYRLRNSLELGAKQEELVRDIFGDRETFALMRLVGLAIRSATGLDANARRTKWYDDPQLFELALEAVSNTLASFSPPIRRAPHVSQDYSREIKWDTVSANAIVYLPKLDDLMALTNNAPTIDHSVLTEPIRQALGHLADRILNRSRRDQK
jgi:hypothetical protein